jgi:hypothetical protein
MKKFKTTDVVLLFVRPSADGGEASHNIPRGTVVEATGDSRSVTGRGPNASEFVFQPVKALGASGFILANHLKETDEPVTPATVAGPSLSDVLDAVAKLDAKVSALKPA